MRSDYAGAAAAAIGALLLSRGVLPRADEDIMKTLCQSSSSPPHRRHFGSGSWLNTSLHDGQTFIQLSTPLRGSDIRHIRRVLHTRHIRRFPHIHHIHQRAAAVHRFCCLSRTKLSDASSGAARSFDEPYPSPFRVGGISRDLLGKTNALEVNAFAPLKLG